MRPTTDSVPAYLDSSRICALSPEEAVRAISQCLKNGFDPAEDTPRISAHLQHGHFLLMPTEAGSVTGIKVATVAPGNPERGLARIQASYLLYESQTLAVKAILDGTALTTLRTPAVSIAAIEPLLGRFSAALRLVVFGGGPQAQAHVDTLTSVVPEHLASVTFILRTPERAGEDLRSRGSVVGIESAEARLALAEADVVVCATSARKPLFGANAVKDSAIIVAVGSHEPDARELDAELLRRSSVVVEDPGAALREAGDIIMAMEEGALRREQLIPMKKIVTGESVPEEGKPVVFKSVGMSWEDLAVAQAVFNRASAER